MPELSVGHKQRLGDVRFKRDLWVFDGEIMPSMATEAVQSFVAELSTEPAVTIPVREEDEDGLYGWPADGIRRKIETHGGSIRFGWRLREWPCVVLVAEFHAVWVDPDGELIDITPSVTEEKNSLFVPDSNYPETFDFDQHPPTRYKVLHTGPDWSAATAKRIAPMKPSQRAYEERRAHKAGKTLEEWVRGKLSVDPLEILITAYIDACKAFDAKLETLPDLVEIDPRTAADLIERAWSDDVGAVLAAADELADVDNADTKDAAVSAEADQAADPGPVDVLPETPDASVEVTGDRPDETETGDDAVEDFEDWLPETETYAAEDALFDWSTARYNRRRAILRAMSDA
jgi:hypothetical protein